MNRTIFTFFALALVACGPRYDLSLAELSLPPLPASFAERTLALAEGTIVRARLVLEDDGAALDDVIYSDLDVTVADDSLVRVLKTGRDREIVFVAHAAGETLLRASYRDQPVLGLRVVIAPQ